MNKIQILVNLKKTSRKNIEKTIPVYRKQKHTISSRYDFYEEEKENQALELRVINLQGNVFFKFFRWYFNSSFLPSRLNKYDFYCKY